LFGHRSSLKELLNGFIRDSDVLSNLYEFDAALSDESANHSLPDT
jgi:hypothetical protein